VVDVVKLVGLHVVLPPGVASGRGQEEMHAVEEEVHRMHAAVEAREEAAEVVDMLHRVHAETSKGLYIYVTMMQAVDVFVHPAGVDEAVGEIEMRGSPDRNDPNPTQKPQRIDRSPHHIAILHTRQGARSPATQETYLETGVNRDADTPEP